MDNKKISEIGDTKNEKPKNHEVSTHSLLLTSKYDLNYFLPAKEQHIASHDESKSGSMSFSAISAEFSLLSKKRVNTSS
jgi:hypothetical protein